ncbi:helix-turn-helix domain-containing protein [Streptomyces sp. 205]|uniref:Helix-turn-helix domain-containing protein n=1 Tax=Streptomyces coffeae TaxID=621382 RepID=A0ABS1NEU7_9ACTN|nr:helix-turn-helix domain-containing protein [Streptomyces coffeae]
MPEAVTALHDRIGALTDEVIAALRGQLSSYAAQSPDRVRPGVMAAVRNGLTVVQRWSVEEHRAPRRGGRDPGHSYDLPAGYLDEVAALARVLPVEDIISAYRIGSDVVWRRFGEEMAARNATAEELLPIAETLRAWTNATTLRIVRSCHAAARREVPTEGRNAALVRALLLGEARWDDPDNGDADAVWDRSTLRLPFRARLPLTGPGDSARAVRPAPGADPGKEALSRALDLLRPWLARDAVGSPLATTVDGDAAGLLAARPSGLCHGLVVGLGAPAARSALATEFARATQALRAAVDSGFAGVFTREELGLRATVVAMPAVGEQLVRLRLEPLAERGEDGVQLEEAAAAYLRQGMRLEAAARSLYVHPNTMRNRLRRFEELTGTNLRDPADLAEVWWALAHRRIHGPAN